MYKRPIEPLAEGFLEAFGKKINVLEGKASRPADRTEGDVKPEDITGEEEVKSDGSAKKAPARKGDQAQADSMEKVKESVDEAMDPVNPVAVKKKFADRKDKDLDNDGDTDSSDEYLHKRRKAISKALAKEEVELDEVSKELKQRYLKKADKDSYDMFTGKKAGSKEKMDKRRASIQKVSKDLEGKKKFADYDPKTKKYTREEAELDEGWRQISQHEFNKRQNAMGSNPGVDHSMDVKKDGTWFSKKGHQTIKRKKNPMSRDGFDFHVMESVEIEEAYKTPEEAKAYEAGKRAWRDKKKYDANPNKDPKLKTAWSRGHNDARAKFVKRYGSSEEKMRYEEVGLDEARKNAAADLYFDTYSAAVQKARKDAEKQGYEVDEDDWHNQVTTGPGKPGRGKTVRHNIKLTKNGKPVRKGLAIQVYNRDTDRNTYELNSYVS